MEWESGCRGECWQKSEKKARTERAEATDELLLKQQMREECREEEAEERHARVFLPHARLPFGIRAGLFDCTR